MTLKIAGQTVVCNGITVPAAGVSQIIEGALGAEWAAKSYLAGDINSTDFETESRVAALFEMPASGPPVEVLDDLGYSALRRDIMRSEAYTTAFAETLAPAVPRSVSNYQARQALINAGLFLQVEALIDAMEKESSAYQAYEYGNNFYREDQWICDLGASLGLSPAQIDALFVAASKIL